TTQRLALARQLARERESQARTLELLNQSAATTSGVLEPALLGHILVERVGELLGGAEAILAWDRAGEGSLSVLIEDPGQFGGPDGHSLWSEEPLLVENYRSWHRATGNGLRSGVRSLAAVPLASRGRRRGVLAAFTRDERPLGHHDVQVLGLLAAQAAPALEAARLHAELVQAHESLTRSNEELARASRHKSDFVANLSHELRTPLNAILGFSELLIEADERAIDPERRLGFLHNVHSSGKHLLNLLNEILDLSKVEAGQMEVRETVFDLSRTIASAISTMSPVADKGGVSVHSRGPDRLLVRADEEKVGQMLLNLISNAIKFTPAGGSVSVEVDATPERLDICVADSGIGISKDDQERIFEEFKQLEGDGQQRQGTGLGLTLTRRLAELHGGRVWVDSEPGAGSRFFVRLPRSVLPAGEDVSQAAEA
ncbi:MAG: GAF domain-containing sensor histidine kinase, partial [Actinobacteria bacterium]|nr:GAF domain-containing sensor histidine kinase [Actinomycetota bacterium]